MLYGAPYEYNMTYDDYAEVIDEAMHEANGIIKEIRELSDVQFYDEIEGTYEELLSYVGRLREIFEDDMFVEACDKIGGTVSPY